MHDIGTMLGIWAHPDDEAYLTGGLMAHAARNGNRVVIVTATKGEGGSWDEKRWPSETMGEVRAAELIDSLNLLGVTEHHWLGYLDGSCADVDPEEAIAKLVPFFEDVQPDSVFTFGPDGMTGHPDHKTVSSWATEAFDRAAKPGATLNYAAVTQEWLDEFAPRFDKFNVFMDHGKRPPTTRPEDMSVAFDLPKDLLDLKLQAIERHVSQVYYMLKYFGEDFFREAHKAEYFRLGAQR
jgi:LmbE family N-acetylglucosaminyl deacetylase